VFCLGRARASRPAESEAVRAATRQPLRIILSPGDSGSPVQAHGELGCRRLRNRNAEFAPDSRRRERRWIYVRGACGNAEAGVKYAFRISHPIRHDSRSKSNRSRSISKQSDGQRTHE